MVFALALLLFGRQVELNLKAMDEGCPQYLFRSDEGSPSPAVQRFARPTPHLITDNYFWCFIREV